MEKHKWNTTPFVGFSVLSLLVPPAGLVLGLVNMKHAARRKQAAFLFVLGVASVAMTIMHFAGHHH